MGGMAVAAGITIELRKTWKYGGEALYFRDPDGHLLEVVTPGVWSIFVKSPLGQLVKHLDDTHRKSSFAVCGRRGTQ